MLFRVKITFEYDGTNYLGWQKQKDNLKPSVQGQIEFSLQKIFQREIEIFVCGRTDAGVHAERQVAHFDISFEEIQKFIKNEELEGFEIKIMCALNAFLKNKQISILELEIFNLKNQNYQNDKFLEKLIAHASNYNNQNFDFHSRFSAKEKTYTYKIINRKQPLGLFSNYFWHISYELPHIQNLEEISSVLVGEHDFSSFRSKFCQSPKVLRNLNWIKVFVFEKNLKPFEYEIHFKINAKSFLHNQVRLMVGTIMYLARLKISKVEAKEMLLSILKQRKRSAAKDKAPACGLYLSEIKF